MSMEFETSRPYDAAQDSNSSLFTDPSMDYLQFDQGSPAFDATMGLNPSESPMAGYSSLGLTAGPMDYTYSPDAFGQGSPRNVTPPLEGISPPMLSYQLAHAEASDDSLLSSPGHRGRPAARVPYAQTVPRSARYNPISVPATRASTRAQTFKQRRDSISNSVDKDSEGLEEEDDYRPSRGGTVDPRREEIRKQRIDSEQKRRDDLRDSFNSLKAVLPPSSQKASKIVIIERSIQYIREQSAKLTHAEQRIRELTAAVERERQLSEQLALKNVHQLHRYTVQDNMSSSLNGSLGPAF